MKPFTCIYDLAHAPISVGDTFLYLAAAWMRMKLSGCDCLDFVLLFPGEDERQGAPIFKDLPRDDRLAAAERLSEMPRLFRDVRNSMFWVGNRADFERNMQAELNSGDVYPPLPHYRAGTYMYYDILNNALPEYIQATGNRPLSDFLNPRIVKWAAKFMRSHAGNSLLVAVNLRLNPDWCAERNSKAEVWREFFKAWPDVPFFVLCSTRETDLLPTLPGNVILTKRFGTTAVQDFALSACAFASIGAASGPSIVPFFGDRPCYLANGSGKHTTHPGSTSDGELLRFAFNLDDQVYSQRPETVEKLSGFLARIMHGDFENPHTTQAASWLD